MTKTHTPGLQSFNTAWSVTEQYYGTRSSVNVTAHPGVSQANYNAQTNMFVKEVTMSGHKYTVKVYLDTH